MSRFKFYNDATASRSNNAKIVIFKWISLLFSFIFKLSLMLQIDLNAKVTRVEKLMLIVKYSNLINTNGCILANTDIRRNSEGGGVE